MIIEEVTTMSAQSRSSSVSGSTFKSRRRSAWVSGNMPAMVKRPRGGNAALRSMSFNASSKLQNDLGVSG